MSLWRPVDMRTWGDAKFVGLSDRAKLLWFRFLSGPELTSLPGLIVAGRAQLAEALGWSVEAFEEAFGEAFRQGMVKADWKARVIWLPNAVRYNKPASPNVVKSWRTHFDNVPECSLKDEAYQALEAFAKGLGKAFEEAFREAFAKPLANQYQYQEQYQEENSCPEPASPASGPAEQSILTFPTSGKVKAWDLFPSKVRELQDAFPALDVVAEARKALAWVQANPAKRKTSNGMSRFLFGWMGRTQDRGGGNLVRKTESPSVTTEAIRQQHERDRKEWGLDGAN